MDQTKKSIYQFYWECWHCKYQEEAEKKGPILPDLPAS